MAAPALSVCLPNYNHARYLRRSLDAILGQSFRDYELIVIDDGSTDGSVELIQEYARKDARVRFYRNEKNRGVIFTLNRALSLATADWVFGAAADDYVLPGYFEQAMELLRRHPHAGLCCGMTGLVGDKEEFLCEAPDRWAEQPCYLTPAELAARVNTGGVPGTAIWNRKEFLRAGGYDGSLRWHADWFPLQVVALRHGVCFIPDRVAVCRYTPHSYSAGQSDGSVQRQVLTGLLRQLRSEKFRDTLPMFAASGVLGQFGPEVVRVIVGAEEFRHAEMLDLIPRALLVFGSYLLTDSNAEVRLGVLLGLERLGGVVWSLIGAIDKAAADKCPRVAEAAIQLRLALLAQIGRRQRLRYHVRHGLLAAFRAAGNLVRPAISSGYRLLNYKLYQRLEQLERIVGRLGAQNEQLRARLESLTSEPPPVALRVHGRSPAVSGTHFQSLNPKARVRRKGA